MAEHNELGKAGENAAVAYLEEHGYLIRHRNWRKGHFELDIVAAKENELVIVEVKTRSNTLFAQPEEAVDLPKIKRTVRAADAYMKLFQIDVPVRYHHCHWRERKFQNRPYKGSFLSSFILIGNKYFN